MEFGKIAIIGAGNMGGSIAKGLLQSKCISPSSIYVSDPKEKALEQYLQAGAHTSVFNRESVKPADMVIFAVKPYHIKQVIDDLKPVLSPDQKIASIVAGVSLTDLEKMTGENYSLFRVMPNTAIAVRESMTCISSNDKGNKSMDLLKALFDELGETAIISEELMPAATVLSSCGTAFALRYVRAAMQGGIEMGFNASMSQFITEQTVKGAVQLLLTNNQHPEWELDKVTTPRGITITGINEMEHKGFSSALIQGLIASFNKMGQH